MPHSVDERTFWFIPRYVLHPSRCSDELHRALVTSNILFGGPLCILDADLIHDQRIRRELNRPNSFFRGLFDNELLKVAVRREADGTQDVAKTAASLTAPGTAISEVDQSFYTNADDLKSLLKDGNTIAFYYELEHAKDRYRIEALKLFQTIQASKKGLPESVAKAICKNIAELPDSASLSWSYFLPDGELNRNLVCAGVSDGIVKKYAAKIHKLARAPYVTFLPDLAHSSALYSNEDKEPMDFYRGRVSARQSERVEMKIERGSPSLADHVQGLNALDVSDLIDILGSTQKRELDRTLALATQGKETTTNLGIAAAAYLRVVDNAILGPNKRRHKELQFMEISNSYFPSEDAQKLIAQFFTWGCKQAVGSVPEGSALLSQAFEVVSPLVKQARNDLALRYGLDLPAGNESCSTPDVEAPEELADQRERLLIQYKSSNQRRPQTAHRISLPGKDPIQLTEGISESEKTEIFGE